MKQWPAPLKLLAAIGIGLHLLCVLLPLAGYISIGLLAGLSAGYLAIASAAYVRVRDARPHFYAAIVAVWLFWIALNLWRQSVSPLDAMIESCFVIVYFVGACLAISFYARWKSRRNHSQFSLVEMIGLMSLVAGVCLFVRAYSITVDLIQSFTPFILTTITACYALAICNRASRAYYGALAGSLVLLLVFHGLEDFTPSFYISVAQWLLLIGGGQLLLQIPKDEIVTQPASSVATASQLPSDPQTGQPDEL